MLRKSFKQNAVTRVPQPFHKPRRYESKTPCLAEHCTGPDLHNFHYNYAPYNSTDWQSFFDTKTVIMTDAKNGRNWPTNSRRSLFFKVQSINKQ